MFMITAAPSIVFAAAPAVPERSGDILSVCSATLTAYGGALKPARCGAQGVHNARHRWTSREGLVLTLGDEVGSRGQGEASPLPGYSPDRLPAVRAALAAWCRQPLPSLDFTAPLLPQVRTVVAALDAGLPAARHAVETALLDLVGHRLGRPVAVLLRPAGPPMPVPLAALLTARQPTTLVAEAEAALDRGIRTLKLKIAAAGEEAADHERLAAVAQATAGRAHLRLDANGALPPAQLTDRLQALVPYHPELVEEPVSGPDLVRLAWSPLPIAVDESLRWDGVWTWLASPAGVHCRAVVLKPMVLGGILPCLDLAVRAQDLGVATLVTHLFDGPLALAAAAALAVALPGERLACGLDRHPGLTAWPVMRLPFLAAGTVRPVAAPGFGLETLELDS